MLGSKNLWVRALAAATAGLAMLATLPSAAEEGPARPWESWKPQRPAPAESDDEAGPGEVAPAVHAPQPPAVSAPPARASRPQPEPPPPAPSDFSADRAWSHLERLVKIGPRVSGTEGAEKTRAYLREQLEAIGAQVVEERTQVSRAKGEPVELVHLIGILPGKSSDIFMLASHYDTFPSDSFENLGANNGGSGTALLLEMGRVLAGRERPYTVWLTFIDGDDLPAHEGATEPSFVGSRALAASLAGEGKLSQVRVAFFFDQVADPDLSIARDLRSHRAYRELVWQSAREIGRGDAFPPSSGFESPPSSHRAFLAQNLRRVVAIVDNHFGGAESPGLYWMSEDDDLEHCSAKSLGTVGAVTVEALDRIEARLTKIDRFVNPPAAPVSN
jgi:glutaminyl-peptide cyclotransferase